MPSSGVPAEEAGEKLGSLLDFAVREGLDPQDKQTLILYTNAWSEFYQRQLKELGISAEEMHGGDFPNHPVNTDPDALGEHKETPSNFVM